jgi:hypothetical protein
MKEAHQLATLPDRASHYARTKKDGGQQAQALHHDIHQAECDHNISEDVHRELEIK